MVQNMHQDFPMTQLYIQITKEKNLNPLLFTMPVNCGAFLSLAKPCPLSLMISPGHLEEETKKVFRDG